MPCKAHSYGADDSTNDGMNDGRDDGMNDGRDAKLDWIFKILAASMVGAATLKYVAPLLPIPETGAVALAIVVAPTVALAGLFVWRSWRSP